MPWWIDVSEASAEVDRARANELGLGVVSEPPESGFYLTRTDSGLTLFKADAAAGQHSSFCPDLTTTVARRSDSRRSSPLARACGLHRRHSLSIVDATAGLGSDSAALAGFGCRITAIERHPVVAALARDALQRARDAGLFSDTWAQIHFDDARRQLSRQNIKQPDVVLIDPMFYAPRRKAKPQKIIAWLGELLGPDPDAEELLSVARRTAQQRVVIKRHNRQQPIGNPTLELGRRAVRFDVYLC